MKKEDISLQIRKNFESAGLRIAEDGLTVQPDPYDGWWIVVVSTDFEGKSRNERKEIALNGLEKLHIEWLELLTPEERETAGTLPGDVELDDLPLWPEALARGSLFEPGKEAVRFISDIDEDIEPPVIATFYSLRGGVGRSTSLAYTAHILASKGQKVLCVDMDLEAPGITALFGKEKEIQEDTGLVPLLIAVDQGETPDIAKHLVRISETYDLYCLPAGRTGANYARQLRFIDPESWYREERNPLRELLDRLRSDLPFTPDVILLDARTGITQMSGPLLFDLSDISIIVFFPHPQARTGTGALVKALLAAKTRREINGKAFTPEIRFLVSPVPSSKAPEVIQRYEHRALDWISDWMTVVKNASSEDDGMEIIETDITHFVPYRETVATSDQILIDEDIWRYYRPVAEWIEGFIEIPGEKDIDASLSDKKTEILKHFNFSTGTAERQEDFLNTFVETDLVKKALSSELPLVIGRKGTGKTAIFRRLSECENGKVFIITSPSALGANNPFFLSVEGFKAIEGSLEEAGADWRNFWTIYTCLISYFLLNDGAGAPLPSTTTDFNDLLNTRPSNEGKLVDLIESFMRVPRYGLAANQWLSQLDEIVNPGTLLLFDGLDTGFGSTGTDRRRRNAALEGLFTFMTDSGSRLKHFKFKVLLREDIWKSLKFENKSHLFGRSLSLKWGDQTAFFKVVIKQAIRNNFYKELIKSIQLPVEQSVEHWADQQVITAWNLLVGERMKGGKTAFTRNWVWKRLADGKDDHSPRYLLQLLHQAVLWEQEEFGRNPYQRSIIRPRALEKVLPEVSVQALGALRDEEFPELEDLMNILTRIGRTPVYASELRDLEASTDLINLAMDVGLLCIYEGSEENVERYKVPEIYRYALKMGRKGQK
jgi:MinD-like ATPase involved in chromosome partitioning or flagellar assembly